MPSKHIHIAANLIEDILSGRYRATERLPSERDLATRFEANRGAVREAMKKLEQIGLIEVQPGGARVKNKEEASLDVISHLLAQGELPDEALIDQIMVVLDMLANAAAQQSLLLATDKELEHMRALLHTLMGDDITQQQHTLIRFELMEAVMCAGRNLPLRLIAHTLIEQMIPNMTKLQPYFIVDMDAYRNLARELDSALGSRNSEELSRAFTAFAKLNRETTTRAFNTARTNIGPEAISQ